MRLLIKEKGRQEKEGKDSQPLQELRDKLYSVCFSFGVFIIVGNEASD